LKGVAWTNLTNAPKSIDDWPGLGDAHESKVPTKIVYNARNMVSKWGFMCDDEEDDETEEVFECFKIYLDKESIDAARKTGLRDMPANTEEAKRLVADYLQQIYIQIKRSIETTTGSWRNKKVEFIFSTPTTWRAQCITNDFEQAIRKAGFGQENKSKHTTKLGLTEAEAAAVYVATNKQVRFANGDIILVCDAGGGTSRQCPSPCSAMQNLTSLSGSRAS
jgi:hypothetical protein